MKRLIIKIDDRKCTGCGQCVPNCAEGALQIVDGKVRLVNEIYCDGLGACLGECPEGALVLEERDAQPFDAEATETHLGSCNGDDTGHGCPGSMHRLLKEAECHHQHQSPAGKTGEAVESILPCGCPSSSERVLDRPAQTAPADSAPAASELGHWPVQLALVSPKASFLRDSDLLISADCVPFAYADFHKNLLKGHSLLIGCPKLDDADEYVKKLALIISQNKPRSITVAHMEVGCCYGLMQIVQEAMKQAGVIIPMRTVIVSVNGELDIT
ncbi:MAG: ATP-binding protein [Bacillota bacterium]